jgi:dUTPase
LPNNLGAIVFAKSGGIADRGILITNTGHVDPGYKGSLRYAVLNMGNEPFSIRVGDRLLKILFFRMSSDAAPDWSKLHPRIERPNLRTLGPLGREFAAFEERVVTLSRKVVDERFLQIGYITLAASTVLSILLSLAALSLTYFTFIESAIGRESETLRYRIEKLESDVLERP